MHPPIKRRIKRRRRRLKHLPLKTAMPQREKTRRPVEAVTMMMAAMTPMMLRPLLQVMIQGRAPTTKLTKQPNPRKLKRRRRQRRQKLRAPILPPLTLALTLALITMMMPMMIARREKTLGQAQAILVVTATMIIKRHQTRTWSRIPMLRRILRKLRRLSRLRKLTNLQLR